MGTNYYMMTKSKKLAEKYFSYEYELVDSPYFGYEIHIGKCSCGWNPLFQQHKQAYSSVKELLEFIENHHKSIRIFDEYEREYDIEGLKEALITWGEKQEKRVIHYNDVIGDIQAPIDHIEMDNRDKEYGRFINIEYWKDEEGYEFTDIEFS